MLKFQNSKSKKQLFSAVFFLSVANFFIANSSFGLPPPGQGPGNGKPASGENSGGGYTPGQGAKTGVNYVLQVLKSNFPPELWPKECTDAVIACTTSCLAAGGATAATAYTCNPVGITVSAGVACIAGTGVMIDSLAACKMDAGENSCGAAACRDWLTSVLTNGPEILQGTALGPPSCVGGMSDNTWTQVYYRMCNINGNGIFGTGVDRCERGCNAAMVGADKDCIKSCTDSCRAKMEFIGKSDQEVKDIACKLYKDAPTLVGQAVDTLWVGTGTIISETFGGGTTPNPALVQRPDACQAGASYAPGGSVREMRRSRYCFEYGISQQGLEYCGREGNSRYGEGTMLQCAFATCCYKQLDWNCGNKDESNRVNVQTTPQNCNPVPGDAGPTVPPPPPVPSTVPLKP